MKYMETEQAFQIVINKIEEVCKEGTNCDKCCLGKVCDKYYDMPGDILREMYDIIRGNNNG